MFAWHTHTLLEVALPRRCDNSTFLLAWPIHRLCMASIAAMPPPSVDASVSTCMGVTTRSRHASHIQYPHHARSSSKPIMVMEAFPPNMCPAVQSRALRLYCELCAQSSLPIRIVINDSPCRSLLPITQPFAVLSDAQELTPTPPGAAPTEIIVQRSAAPRMLRTRTSEVELRRSSRRSQRGRAFVSRSSFRHVSS